MVEMVMVENGNGQFNRDYEWKFKTTEKQK